MQPSAHALRSATAELLGNALNRSGTFSLAGLQERAFVHAFRNLVYAQIWEDPVVDLEALDIGPACHVVTIASGGCNLMTYLTADPARITAVDLNSAHVALCRLKLAAASHLNSHTDFFRLFGEASSRTNVEIYDTTLRPNIDHMTRAYWESRNWRGRRRIEMLAHNVYRFGLLGRFIGAAHLLARALGSDPRDMLAARTRDEQVEIYQRTLAPLFRKRIVRWMLNNPASLFGLGIPPAQFDSLSGGRPGGAAAVVERRLARLACDYDLSDNYFAWQAFARAYGPAGQGPLPLYLQEHNFAAIRSRAARVDVRLASLTEHLSGQPRASVDRFVLLDAQDWMTDADLTQLWQEITRTARPQARVIFRTAAAHDLLPGRVPDRILQHWSYERARSLELHARDRSAIYGGFHLYVLR